MMSAKRMRLSQIEIEELIMISSSISNTPFKMQIKCFNVFTINMGWRMPMKRSFSKNTTRKEKRTTMMYLKFLETPLLIKSKRHLGDWPLSTILKIILAMHKQKEDSLKSVKRLMHLRMSLKGKTTMI